MTGCEREGAGLPRVCCVEMKNGLLTPSTRCLHTGQWPVLQPISPSKASSGVNTSRGVRNGRTGDGTRLADSSVFPRAQPDGLGSVGNGHLGPLVSVRVLTPKQELRVGLPGRSVPAVTGGNVMATWCSSNRKGSSPVTAPQVAVGRRNVRLGPRLKAAPAGMGCEERCVEQLRPSAASSQEPGPMATAP